MKDPLTKPSDHRIHDVPLQSELDFAKIFFHGHSLQRVTSDGAIFFFI